jgi:copper transporter 1
MLQFAVAYLIMLLAMYYNGYLIISIFAGSYIGAFIFSWESISVANPVSGGTGTVEETTYCCG